MILDAYAKSELDYHWLKGNRNDHIIVMDKHLAELALTDTETIKGFEHYAEGGYMTKNLLNKDVK